MGNHTISQLNQYGLYNSKHGRYPWQTFSGQGVLRIPERRIKISMWNVKILYRSGKLVNFEAEMMKLKWEIQGMIVVRWSDELPEINKKTLFNTQAIILLLRVQFKYSEQLSQNIMFDVSYQLFF